MLGDQHREKPRAYTGMNANTHAAPRQTLGEFLRDRRARLSPAPSIGRRRTPGLRREEVATRAGVSVTWYTWLEQGRGGSPSEDVLERLSRALELDRSGREVLFLLAQQTPPPVTPPEAPIVPATLQPVLDALSPSPAIAKTALWDVVAWNAAADVVLGGYRETEQGPSNVLRRLFSPEFSRDALPEWEDNARFAVSVFRVDTMRRGVGSQAAELAAELHASSADFRRFWAENEIMSKGEGSKRIAHPVAGPLTFNVSSYLVDHPSGLTMIVFTPQTPADAAAVADLVRRRDMNAG